MGESSTTPGVTESKEEEEEEAPVVVEYGENQPRLAKFRLDWSLLREEALEPPRGGVSLRCKTGPVDSMDEGESALYTVARCDVSQVAAKLAFEGDRVWSPEYSGVSIERPSHDAWGIRKLIFVFCDDFLDRAYHMPLWSSSSSSEWRVLLEPILARSVPPGCQLVRCLLASMPPRTVIPEHQDSGFWVPRTHRCHCAITTNDSVVFKAGGKRYRLEPGRVVELNNQAKHYVANLAAAAAQDSSFFRTHLIFDYVEPWSTIPFVEVSRGDALSQTRRTIALESERGTGPPPPHFVILGAQKAGTTSMYEHLARHPLVVKGKRRETHFLDWRWGCRGAWEGFYDSMAHAAHPALRAGDSSPSYLLRSDLALPRLRQLGRDKDMPFVVMLRDPVARAASHFAMITDPNATPAQRKTRGDAWLGRPVEDIVADEISSLVKAGLLVPKNNNHNLQPNNNAHHTHSLLKGAFDLDPTKLNDVLERLPHSGAHSLLLRGLYALQLGPWLAAFPRSRFIFIRCEDLDVSPHRTQHLVADVQAHIGLKPHPLSLADAAAKHNTRHHDPLPPALHAALRSFFRPFNQDLYRLLGWQDANLHWD